MIPDLATEEKDLVILLGSFLIYKEVELLYELIQYIKSYSAEDVLQIINTVKHYVTSGVLEWFTTFLMFVNDKELVHQMYSIKVDDSLYQALGLVDAGTVDYFIEFWG